MKRLFAILFGLASLTVQAQDEVEEWFQNGRPIHEETVIYDETGKHLAPRKLGSQATAPLKASGTQRVPVVLVAFPDMAFSVADSTDSGVNAFYNLFCNGTMDGVMYTGHGSHGSIRDYFVEQSDSTFFPEFTVIGPVVLDSSYTYYGKNSASGSKDVNISAFRNQAIAKAQEIFTDWDTFDNDGNGTVDMVFFIYAGMGENTKGGPDAIWPKESSSSVTINGRTFSCYGCTCEARPDKRDENGNVLTTKVDGVGVPIHELSHALGLPDFYDTRSVAFGMDIWSVMDYGEYGNNGYNPGNYTAYERDFMGWRQLKTLDEPQILTIDCFADGGYGYKIINDANANEYYILENRQAKGWDDKICLIGHGLQVTHVDYNASRWNGNTVNTDANHQRMTIIAANNNYEGTNVAQTAAQWRACLEGNLFPGADFKFDLTDDSDPAATVYAGELMHKPIRNITENEDGTITLCYRTNGQLDTPVALDPDSVDVHSFRANWGEVEYATNYIIELEDEDQGIISVDTLQELSLAYADLRDGTKLKYHVKAIADSPEDYLDSEWSEYVYLETLVDLIEGVDDSAKLVEVYTMTGKCVSRCYADQVNRLDLHNGIYVLRYSNGATKKILRKY